MKKILLVTRPIAPPWDEASKNFAYYLAKNLNLSNQLELHLMTKGILPELPRQIVQEAIYTASQNDFSFSQKIRSLLFQIKHKKKFDITHYFFTPTKLNTFFIKKFIKNSATKSIQTVATLREDIFSDEEIKNLMFSNLIITYSDYAKHRLNNMGIQNVTRIYPGIDLNKYKKQENASVLRKKYNFFPNDFVLNFTGEYTRLGAIDNVIKSFIALTKKYSNIKLSLAVRVKNEKDAQKKESIVSQLKQQGLLNRVSFHDDGNFQMSDIYNLCDISLFPVQNMYGKFDVPLAAIEAMACEKPLILSDLPILKEFTNKKNALIIKKDSILELSSAIIELYTNKQKRGKIGIEGRKFCLENFDIKQIAEKYEKIYTNQS
jgi:glycosyltransferase involved in cell wall biosynthesis